jgi:aspartyl-tRNA(Asn)/glutamyl-tRNA(Gln) amidotransferase subunit A
MSFAANPGSVRDLATSLGDGSLTSEALVRRCLDRIEAVDGAVQAWIHVLSDEALATAKALDAERRAKGPRGLLHGIPVAVKDVIDVAGLPTRANSRSRADAPPAALDATVVAHLRAAGAVILGKVHTTEYAYFESVPPTRNPHDLTRTPGGSSAGSSAAVAAGMVPLALGTQTAGSVNRPAAYTGIGAFKPTTRAVSSSGIVPLAPSYDTVGAFGATPQDAVLLAAAYADGLLRLEDADPLPLQRITLLEDPLITHKASAAAVQAFDALTDRLRRAGFAVETAPSPVAFEDIIADHRNVLLFEMARLHGSVPRHLLAPKLAADIERGWQMGVETYHAALHRLSVARSKFWSEIKRDTALLIPAAPDIAPDDGSTGDPAFVIPVTALGGPVASVRAGLDPLTGMPLGAMLFAGPGADRSLAGLLLSDRARSAEL